MNLRTRILLFLFIFALAPLLVAVVINLPLVLDRVELFYRQAILQHIRADFRDLDQHLASRDEMVRLLAKLPEPGAVMGTVENNENAKIDIARVRYTEWINRILSDQLDIREIVFIDEQGTNKFWLTRDSETRQWLATAMPPELPSAEQLVDTLQSENPIVNYSPLRVSDEAITLQLSTPIVGGESEANIGAVIMTVDIAGLMRANPNTLWVHADGRYLRVPGVPVKESLAFTDYPGLIDTFGSGNHGLWEGPTGKIIWVPLLRTEDNQILWAGRSVNDQPLEQVRETLIVRVLSIILGLVILIGLSARWIATRAQSFGTDLISGISRVMEKNEPVIFHWRGSPEIIKLGDDLTALTNKHASNSRNLAAHAAELEASNRYKSEFLANVSHELKTPLNSILSLSKLLQNPDSQLSDAEREQVNVIHLAGEDLKRLIDNILDLSKIEAGKLELHIDTVNLPQLAQDLAELMAPQFAEKHLQFDLKIDPETPTDFETDADKLRQILKNFLGNAVKFTSEGKVTLIVEPASPPHAIALRVRDQGIGIPGDKHLTIFEAFKQADGSTSRRYGGTGLGLSISNQLAEMLGGEITLESEAGEGALFSLLLPIAHQQEAATRRVKTSPTPPKEDKPSSLELPEANLGGLHVLLVDQDVQQLLKLSQWLRHWHAEITVANDAEEACEALSEDPDCDLVLLAAGMPGLDSYATIESIKAAVPNKSLLVAFVGDQGPTHPDADFQLATPTEASELLPVLIEARQQLND
ncbi:MAG: ATP-binding response regulator [bacterium]